MNTKEMLRMLSEYFSDFECHVAFLEEFYSILRKNVSGKEKLLFKQLAAQLENIKKMGRMVYMADDNEQIKGKNGYYYSIHLTCSQYNIRLLIHISKDGAARFLSAFYERAGKSRTNYSTHTPVLEQRLKQLIGDDDYE